MPRLSYFFPAHNEEANLEGLVDEALAALPTLAETFEIIAVNDGSSDGTAAIADTLVARHPDVVRVVHHGVNRGYGEALGPGSGPLVTSWSRSPMAIASSRWPTSGA